MNKQPSQKHNTHKQTNNKSKHQMKFKVENKMIKTEKQK